VASIGSVQISLCIAAVTGSLGMFLAQKLAADRSIEEDLTPSNEFKVPVADTPPLHGHVVATIEYIIDPARAAEFLSLMQESRRSRLRQGALSWELRRDIADPSRYLEQITDESWTEHLRRFDRVTAGDVALRDRKLGFHLGDGPPLVTRWAVDPGS
jgi:quinol monooxygenase YgiN